ncbi:hypothetical protein D3C78_1735610 [compost metagenome]
MLLDLATTVFALVDLAGVRLACLVDFATVLPGAAFDFATTALYGTCSSSFCPLASLSWLRLFQDLICAMLTL